MNDLRREFFEDILGWVECMVNDRRQGFEGHFDKDHKRFYKAMPTIENSLDLQEEWVWPLLHKLKIIESSFYYYVEQQEFSCMFTKANHSAMGKTKAEAQLTAAMKVLRTKNAT